jgi:cell fate regulator YaaT (PSP1 superfamily)
MPTVVVGIRLRFSKTLWFDPAGSTPEQGDLVIVETERGTEIGTVVQPPHEVTADQLVAPLKPVVRVANEEDLAEIEELKAKEREALPVFRTLVEEYKLDMKPIDVEYLLSGDKVVFYFSAEERVDFRELVKDLASRFHARIDMRQVGVRDEARMVGGVGHCGQMLCCVRFGGEFQPVSIRMAKEQDLPLNPLKISGLCGRLMCCLRYEFDAYKDFKGRAPKRGAIVETPVGLAKVVEFNTPRENITLRFEDGSRSTVPLSGMSCGKGTGCPCQVSQEALEEAGNPAAVALAAEAETPMEFEAPKLREPKRERREPKRDGKREAKPETKPEAAEPTGEATEGGSSSRRRRRRRSGSGSGSG